MTMPSKERIIQCMVSGAGPADVSLEARRLLQRAMARARGQRPGRDPGDQGGLRRPRRPLAGQLDQGGLGHGLGAAAAIEAAVCVRAIREQIIPPTINYLADPELRLDYVPDQARAARVKTVVSALFGFGGTNNVLILGEPKI